MLRQSVRNIMGIGWRTLPWESFHRGGRKATGIKTRALGRLKTALKDSITKPLEKARAATTARVESMLIENEETGRLNPGFDRATQAADAIQRRIELLEGIIDEEVNQAEIRLDEGIQLFTESP